MNIDNMMHSMNLSLVWIECPTTFELLLIASCIADRMIIKCFKSKNTMNK
jgi:hypothetical protein